MKGWITPAGVLLIAFVLTRLPALDLHMAYTDVHIYARYAAEWHAAERRGVSVYDHHRQRVEQEMTRTTPNRAAILREQLSVEYPPLAIATLAAVALFVEDPFYGEYPLGLPSRYALGFLVLMALCDVGVFLLTLWLVRRLYPLATPGEWCERCLIYVLASWPLYALLYTRMDLGLALLVMGSLALLVSRWHWSLALVVLALGIHFKLLPAVLAPVWLVAALPEASLRASWGKVAFQLAIRAAVPAAVGVGVLAIFYALQGPGIFDFLSFHRNRGIEIESTWSTLLLLLWQIGGGDWNVYFSHGSVNVDSPLAPAVTAVSMWVMASLVLAASALFCARVWRRDTSGEAWSPGRATASDTVGQTRPRLVAGFTLLLLLISAVANKVFSPQYLIWILPLVPLLDFPPRPRRLFYLTTFIVAVLTMRIFPDLWVPEIMYYTGVDENQIFLFGGPTPLGASILYSRNALCVGLTAALAWSLARPLFGARQNSPPAAEGSPAWKT